MSFQVGPFQPAYQQGVLVVVDPLIGRKYPRRGKRNYGRRYLEWLETERLEQDQVRAFARAIAEEVAESEKELAQARHALTEARAMQRKSAAALAYVASLEAETLEIERRLKILRDEEFIIVLALSI